MKVYITYCKDGYNGSEIDRVFSTLEKAIDYIINSKFNYNNYYMGKDNIFLKTEAQKYIDEREIE